MLQNMQHKQTYPLSDEVHTPYFREKHSTLIHKLRVCLNTVILNSITSMTVYTSITNDQNKVKKLPIT